MTKSLFRIGLTCLSVGMLACESEPELVEISSTEAALTATENSERALQGLVDASDFLTGSSSIGATLSLLGQSESCEINVAPCADGNDCVPEEVTCESGEIEADELATTREELREGIGELVSVLRERILIESNLEGETATSATYRLGPDVLCPEGDEPSGTAGAPSSPDLDQGCVDEVTRLEPRLVLTSPREGDIDVTVLLGSERRAPLSFQLHRQSLGVRLDLNEAFDLANDLGEDMDDIEALSGQLELRLVENQARDYTLELNVLERLRVVVDSDGETLEGSLEASSPASNIRLDGNSGTLSAGLNLGALRVLGPLSAFAGSFQSDTDSAGAPFGAPPPEGDTTDTSSDARVYTGVLDLFLAGLSGNLSYTAGTDVLRLNDIGFGGQTSTLKHDGNTLFALDLNATQGRRFNLEVQPAGEDGARIEITPTFELQLELAFQYVADQFDDIAEYLYSDTLRVWFTGDAPAVELGDAGVRILSGTLNVASAAEPAVDLAVEAGMCLGEAAEEAVASEHPFASLEAIACE